MALLQPGDTDSGNEPGSRRAPDAWREGERVRKAVQGDRLRPRYAHTGLIDYEQVERLASGAQTKDDRDGLLRPIRGWSTGSASAPLPIRWVRWLFADMAHVAGLVAAGEYPSPVAVGRRYDDDDAQNACADRAVA